MRYTGRNPWDVLGLPEDAPFDDVKRAYLRRARTTHPDVPGGSAEAFRQVRSAFEELQRRPPRRGRPARPSPYERWTSQPGRPTAYDRWTSRPGRPARQWIDDDPLVATAPAAGRQPGFADLLRAELLRRRTSAA